MTNYRSVPKSKSKRSVGFSLVETMAALLVLFFVMAWTFERIDKAQTNYRVETQKIDFTEEQRTFMDQITRDLHQAGYPSLNNSPGAPANSVAAQNVTIDVLGITLTMEGDLDGTGTVQVVTYDYNAATGNLERTATPKGLAPGQPTIMVQNVLAPAGPIFQAYDQNGQPIGGAATGKKSIGITFTLQGNPGENRKTIQTTMTSMARLPNF